MADAQGLNGDSFDMVSCLHDTEGAGPKVEDIRAGRSEAFAFAADVSSATQVEAMFAAYAARFGRLDVVVNNAGNYDFAPPLEDITEESFTACST